MGFLKNISLSFILIILFLSCNQSPVAEVVSESDKLIIHFIERGKIVKTVTTTDKNAIKKMVYAIDNGDAKPTNCELTGKMIFLKSEAELQQVNFSSIPECRYFSYHFEGKQQFSSMTNETANFLQSVMLGLDFY